MFLGLTITPSGSRLCLRAWKMENLDEKLRRVWERLSYRQKKHLLSLMEMLAEAISIPSDVAKVTSHNALLNMHQIHQRSVSKLGAGVHALLKLGTAKTGEGRIVTAAETFKCLDESARYRVEPLFLGTNSQAVSRRFQPLIRRLYLMADFDPDKDEVPNKVYAVRRVLDIDRVLDQLSFEELRSHESVRTCPDGMSSARTWFGVSKVWKVVKCPPVEEIRLLKTGESIQHAISAGRATFFYVNPIEGMELEAI